MVATVLIILVSLIAWAVVIIAVGAEVADWRDRHPRRVDVLALDRQMARQAAADIDQLVADAKTAVRRVYEGA